MVPIEKFSEIHAHKIEKGNKTYLHLELFENYRIGQKDVKINGYKENTFALGLIILEIALNIDLQNLYADKYQLLKSIPKIYNNY